MNTLKVFVIIYRVESDRRIEFLALRNNPADPEYGGAFWYVVTGNVEPGETLEAAARREVDEETGIKNIRRVINPHKVFRYQYRDVKVKEHAYLMQVDEDVHHLNEENVEHQWLEADAFMALIQWEDDKNQLKALIDRAEND